MRAESLEELAAAFADWRSRKRHAREATPGELLERARLTVEVHGLGRVAEATGVDRGRLRGDRDRKNQGGEVMDAVPSFSRLEVMVPSTGKGPIAEVETAEGLKLRIFTETRETLGLLSSIFGIGGVP